MHLQAVVDAWYRWCKYSGSQWSYLSTEYGIQVSAVSLLDCMILGSSICYSIFLVLLVIVNISVGELHTFRKLVTCLCAK